MYVLVLVALIKLSFLFQFKLANLESCPSHICQSSTS